MMFHYNPRELNNLDGYGGLIKAFYTNSPRFKTSHIELVDKSEFLSAETGAKLFEGD